MMIWPCPRLQRCLQSFKSRKLQKRSDSSSNNLKISAKKPKKMPKSFYRNKSANKSKIHNPSSFRPESSYLQLGSLQPNRESRSKKLHSLKGFKAPKLFPLSLNRRSLFKGKPNQSSHINPSLKYLKNTTRHR